MVQVDEEECGCCPSESACTTQGIASQQSAVGITLFDAWLEVTDGTLGRTGTTIPNYVPVNVNEPS